MKDILYASKIPLNPYLKNPFILLRDGTQLCVTFLNENQDHQIEVKVVDRKCDDYILKNHHGIEMEYPKFLFEHNKKEIINGKIKLECSEYRNCFISGRSDNDETLFFEHFNLLYKNRTFIMSDSRYFLIRIPKVLKLNLMYIGGLDYCLGSLFESWNSSRKLYTHLDKTGEKIRIIRTGGSPLSGMHEWTGWGEESKKIFYGGTRAFMEFQNEELTNSKVKSFIDLWMELQKIGLRYPDYCNVDHADLKELIDKLKSMDN